MTALQEVVSLDAVSVWLPREIQEVRRNLESERGRAFKTIIRTPRLHVFLIAVHAGGELSAHTAGGPLTIHVIDGCIDVFAEGRRYTLGAGMLMSLEAGIPHSVASDEGGLFLLTVFTSQSPQAVQM